jgi:hypothetical protein
MSDEKKPNLSPEVAKAMVSGSRDIGLSKMNANEMFKGFGNSRVLDALKRIEDGQKVLDDKLDTLLHRTVGAA